MSPFLDPRQGSDFAGRLLAQWPEADSTVLEVVESAAVGGCVDLTTG